MIHHLVAASAATVFYGGVDSRPPRASRRPAAAARDGNHHHDGNGHHNRNIISVRSPTNNRGYQHTSNGNAGGVNPVQNALCRHVTVCTINQKVNIIQPARPAEPVTVPVQTLPETVVPQSIARPAEQPVERPVERPVVRQLRGPFMYMGVDGFMLMAPESGTPAAFGSSLGGTGSFLPFGFFG
jgi:hypothetical protein